MVSKRKLWTYIILVAMLGIVIYFLYRQRVKIGSILTPFFMAVAIAYLFQPLVKKMERKGIKRSMAILLLYLFFSLAAVTIIIFIVPEFIRNTKELMSTIPDIVVRYQRMFNNLMSTVKSSNWPPDIKNAIFVEVQDRLSMLQVFSISALKNALTSLIETFSVFLDLVLAMVIAYYFIKDAEFFREMILSLTPRKWRSGLINAGREINQILSNFIQGQLLTALIVGTLETIGLLIFKVKYSLVLGLIGGIANIIPYFGPIIGAVPAVAMALIESPVKAVQAAIVFTIVQQIDNGFISPKIIEGKLGLHPVTTILAVLIGGEFFGILGMLLSVPAMAILKVIVRRAYEAIV